MKSLIWNYVSASTIIVMTSFIYNVRCEHSRRKTTALYWVLNIFFCWFTIRDKNHSIKIRATITHIDHNPIILIIEKKTQ